MAPCTAASGSSATATRRSRPLPFSRLAFAGSSSLIHTLAAGVRAAGIRRVTDGVYGDESAFDAIRRGPDWKNDSYLDCPPLSALTVNEGYLSFGSLATVPSQALSAAQQLVRALQRQGIAIGQGSHTGVHPSSARPVASAPSPTMHKLVFEMDQVSDNFFAETLTKDLAVGAGQRGSTRAGTTITRRYLRGLGVDLAGATLFDGSGLSKADRLSARQIVGILRRAAVQPYGWFYRHALPLAGVSGTLYNRMTLGAGLPKRARQDRHAGRRIRAVGLRHHPQRPPPGVLDPDERAPHRRARRARAPGPDRAAPGRLLTRRFACHDPLQVRLGDDRHAELLGPGPLRAAAGAGEQIVGALRDRCWSPSPRGRPDARRCSRA